MIYKDYKREVKIKEDHDFTITGVTEWSKDQKEKATATANKFDTDSYPVSYTHLDVYKRQDKRNNSYSVSHPRIYAENGFSTKMVGVVSVEQEMEKKTEPLV